MIAAFALVLSAMFFIGVAIYLELRETNRIVRSFVRFDRQPKKDKR